MPRLKCHTIAISLAKLGSRRIISIYGSERGEIFVAFVDAVTPLELERSVFDSDETQILSAAFEKAWAYASMPEAQETQAATAPMPQPPPA